MNLIDQLTAIFKKALTRVFELEATKNPWYLRQTVFGCRVRAWIGITLTIYYAKSDLVKLLGLGIAKHREETHGENKEKTITTLSRSLNMTPEEVGASSFWNE